VPPSPQQKAALRLRCRGLDQDQLADAFIVLRRDGELYRGVPEVEGGALALTDLPVGRYAAWLSGRTQRCPTLDLGEIDVGAGGADVDVEVPPLGRLRCELALADGRAPGRQRAFIRNAHGVEVPLHAASSELTLTAGAWRLFAGGIDFLPVRDLEFAVAPGATTALRVPLVPATVRHVAFWLPADVDRGRAAVAISMGERLIHEGDPGLDDHGFDATVDGFCSIVLPLAAGAHVLDLRDGGSRFRGEFVVGETDGRQEPIVVALRPVR
jgi:hypothetical protein